MRGSCKVFCVIKSEQKAQKPLRELFTYLGTGNIFLMIIKIIMTHLVMANYYNDGHSNIMNIKEAYKNMFFFVIYKLTSNKWLETIFLNA